MNHNLFNYTPRLTANSKLHLLDLPIKSDEENHESGIRLCEYTLHVSFVPHAWTQRDGHVHMHRGLAAMDGGKRAEGRKKSCIEFFYA